MGLEHGSLRNRLYIFGIFGIRWGIVADLRRRFASHRPHRPIALHRLQQPAKPSFKKAEHADEDTKKVLTRKAKNQYT
ncbi:hypothetical protein L2E82_03677 [Cichorium intybus]|uniref:Uncharacterized protein n=1 Tax=Cichorium intybus TaxID=13427 RepID=A0ACB9H6G4_CICIN|nr:hypothetical protein L2E82_03677 [Cichorium intybus]